MVCLESAGQLSPSGDRQGQPSRHSSLFITFIRFTHVRDKNHKTNPTLPKAATRSPFITFHHFSSINLICETITHHPPINNTYPIQQQNTYTENYKFAKSTPSASYSLVPLPWTGVTGQLPSGADLSLANGDHDVAKHSRIHIRHDFTRRGTIPGLQHDRR